MGNADSSLSDLLTEQDEAKAHEHSFCLWPRLWQEYARRPSHAFQWRKCRFAATSVSKVPQKPGLYTFVVQPCVARHPSCSYLMYIGKTKRTLRTRFREYLSSKGRVGTRPNISRLLNKYPDNLYFLYTTVEDGAQLGQMEEDLIAALVPPYNRQLPAKVSRVVGVLR